MFNLEHFLLFGILYLVSFSFIKFKTDYIRKRFWKGSLFFIILYTIIVGCRYGWGTDYSSYEYNYNHLKYEAGADYGYYLLTYFENYLDFPFQLHILLCAFVYIFSSYYLIKKTGVANVFMLMLFLPATIMFSTYAIRQSLALSIIYIFIGYAIFGYWKQRYRIARICFSILLLIIAYSIHAASIIFVIPFLVFLLYKNVKVIPYQVAIIVYLVVIIFIRQFSSFFNEIISNYISLLTLDSHLQSYIENSEVWFGEEASNEAFAHSGIYQYFVYLSNISILYIIGKTLTSRMNKNIAIIYNIFIISIILQEIFYTQEIMRRIIDPFVIISFIPLGYGIGNLIDLNNLRFSKNQSLYYLSVILALAYLYYPQFKFLTGFPLADFIWNH